jgi:transposase
MSPSVLDRINPHATGIDCGSAEHYVAAPPGRSSSPVQSFKTFTSDLLRLADWLPAQAANRTAARPDGLTIPID